MIKALQRLLAALFGTQSEFFACVQDVRRSLEAGLAANRVGAAAETGDAKAIVAMAMLLGSLMASGQRAAEDTKNECYAVLLGKRPEKDWTEIRPDFSPKNMVEATQDCMRSAVMDEDWPLVFHGIMGLSLALEQVVSSEAGWDFIISGAFKEVS